MPENAPAFSTTCDEKECGARIDLGGPASVEFIPVPRPVDRNGSVVEMEIKSHVRCPRCGREKKVPVIE